MIANKDSWADMAKRKKIEDLALLLQVCTCPPLLFTPPSCLLCVWHCGWCMSVRALHSHGMAWSVLANSTPSRRHCCRCMSFAEQTGCPPNAAAAALPGAAALPAGMPPRPIPPVVTRGVLC